MGETCSMHGDMRHMPTYKIEVEILKRRDCLGALDMDGRIIIKLRPT
jgi:hypothetical protein